MLSTNRIAGAAFLKSVFFLSDLIELMLRLRCGIRLLRIKLLLIYDSVFLLNTKLISRSVLHVYYRRTIGMKAVKRAKKKEIPVRFGP